MILLPIICILLFIFAIFDSPDAADSGCSTAASYSDLNIVFQQTQGTEDTTSYAHQLTLPPTSSGQTCSGIEGAMLLGGATTTCPTTCLTSIQAYAFSNDSSYIDIAMLRPADLALYPNYTKSGSVIYCASTSGNCGATIPYFAFYSATYADHYLSTSTSLPDSTYNFDNSGYPVCFGWKMPSTTADKQTVASAYSTLSSTTCNVPVYLGLVSTTVATTVATTTNANTATTTVAAGATTTVAGATTAANGATTAANGATTAANGATTAANGATTAAGGGGGAVTDASGGATTAASGGSDGGTTAAGGATDGSGGAATTAAGGGSGSATTAVDGSNTDSSGGAGTTAPNSGGAATTAPPVVATDSSGNAVTDASGNPVYVTTESSNKSGTRVWVWVVLGVGLFVFLLMLLGMIYFMYTNFLKPVNSQRIRVNPYDRDIYTTDGMSEPPPVPVSSMPAAGAT
uniref:Uncharacterized protein n=1 Tax=Panagrellus redivivus TaxID=6233 RepID=A0A7E4W3X7_PANRE